MRWIPIKYINGIKIIAYYALGNTNQSAFGPIETFLSLSGGRSPDRVIIVKGRDIPWGQCSCCSFPCLCGDISAFTVKHLETRKCDIDVSEGGKWCTPSGIETLNWGGCWYSDNRRTGDANATKYYRELIGKSVDTLSEISCPMDTLKSAGNDTIRKLKNLKHLKIYHIGDDELQTITSNIEYWPNLTRLSFEGFNGGDFSVKRSFFVGCVNLLNAYERLTIYCDHDPDEYVFLASIDFPRTSERAVLKKYYDPTRTPKKRKDEFGNPIREPILVQQDPIDWGTVRPRFRYCRYIHYDWY